MQTVGFYGKSGTGKSFHAMEVARHVGADALIDDGLLIAETTVLAGKSAKREKTKIGAIKTALFKDDSHAEDVRRAIEKIAPETILILGTSPEMVEKIAERLGLPKPSELVRIEDIASEKEREFAQKTRKQKGTHVIPAPTLEIKRQFSGHFMDPLSLLRDLLPGKAKTEGARTLVRPTYSYLGEYEIADSCLAEIVAYIAKKTDGVSRVSRIQITPEVDSVALSMSVFLTKSAYVPEAAKTLQRSVRTAIEDMTAFNISGVRVDVRGYQ